MASTYTSNQGLEKPATGDRSGTWGTMTNTNMDILDRSISGVGALSLTGTTTALATSDGSASDGNYKVLILGGSPSDTNVITLSPNDADKLYFVINASGESVTFTQGTGSNVTIANNTADIIYADGAGGGAAVASFLAKRLVLGGGIDVGGTANLDIVDIDGAVQIDSTVTVGVDDTGYDVKFFGDTASAYMLWDTSTDDLVLAGAAGIVIPDAGYIGSASDTDAIAIAASGTVTLSGDLTVADDVTLSSDASILAFGQNADTTLTHVHDTGLLLNSTMALQFNDASQYINAPTATVLDINATDEVEINATLADVNANLDVSGTYQGGGTMTTGGNIVIPDGGNIGSATTPTAIDILGTGEIGLGNTAYTGAQTYIYDNTTGRAGLRVQLGNASSTQIGIHCSTDGAGPAIYGSCAAAHWGVYGLSAGNYAVYGQTQSASYGGCFGISASGSNYGILGHANTYGVYGTTVHSVGALTKGSGTFLIPHPLKSEIEGEPWSLAHSFIEGPQCDLIYRGRATLVDGQATISLDTKYGMTAGTFEWLTKAEDVQTFTSNETGWDAVKSSFSGDTITIECQNASSTDTISWMVVAERGDPNIISSTITDDDGNLIIERPSEPEPPLPPAPPPPED